MPCILNGEMSVPIADYGTSNLGRLKHVYRHGLWHRYGRIMQCISGIHYNISLPQPLLNLLAEQQGKSAQTYQSLPVYFSNVCLRFLPVFDLMIQRFLECPHMLGDSIGLILDQMGSLYKFHGERAGLIS